MSRPRRALVDPARLPREWFANGVGERYAEQQMFKRVVSRAVPDDEKPLLAACAYLFEPGTHASEDLRVTLAARERLFDSAFAQGGNFGHGMAGEKSVVTLAQSRVADDLHA